jgi:hypothetical protein
MSECLPARKGRKTLQKVLILERSTRSPKLLNRELDFLLWRALLRECSTPASP